jgi:hypothetical protein
VRRQFKILSSSQSCGLADAIPQPCVPRDQGSLLREWRQRPRPFPKSIHYLSRGKCCVPSLKSGNLVTSAVFKNWICPMVTPSSFKSPLPICDLGAEQILIMIVLRTARQILIGIIAQGYCGSR